MRGTLGAVAVSSVVALTGGIGLAAAGPGSPQLPEGCRTSGGSATRIAAAKLFIEFNATDDDIGVHGAFDDHGWSELCVFDPSGRPILVTNPRGTLNDLTLAGIFFESREPPAAEYSFADLRADFPEGRYRVVGRNVDGTVLRGSAWFTHDVPRRPRITNPQLAAEPEQVESPVPRRGFRVRWDPVRRTTAGEPVDITGYEVIVTKEVEDDPHGFSRPTYDVHVPAAQHSLRVPRQFLEPRTVYELEVLALERSGNQTISVGFLRTR